MKRAQLELALRLAGKVARDADFIVFGSQSILGTIARPPKACIVSMEVDLYPRRRLEGMRPIITQLGPRSPFARTYGFHVDCVTPEVADFPEGWVERLTPFRTKRTGGVTGWCVELHDLAVSKLAAGREKDLTYVQALLDAKQVRPAVLNRRIASLSVTAVRRAVMIYLVKRLVRQNRMKDRAKLKAK
jgi:hypothetical protein